MNKTSLSNEKATYILINDLNNCIGTKEYEEQKRALFEVSKDNGELLHFVNLLFEVIEKNQ